MIAEKRKGKIVNQISLVKRAFSERDFSIEDASLLSRNVCGARRSRSEDLSSSHVNLWTLKIGARCRQFRGGRSSWLGRRFHERCFMSFCESARILHHNGAIITLQFKMLSFFNSLSTSWIASHVQCRILSATLCALTDHFARAMLYLICDSVRVRGSLFTDSVCTYG